MSLVLLATRFKVYMYFIISSFMEMLLIIFFVFNDFIWLLSINSKSASKILFSSMFHVFAIYLKMLLLLLFLSLLLLFAKQYFYFYTCILNIRAVPMHLLGNWTVEQLNSYYIFTNHGLYT